MKVKICFSLCMSWGRALRGGHAVALGQARSVRRQAKPGWPSVISETNEVAIAFFDMRIALGFDRIIGL